MLNQIPDSDPPLQQQQQQQQQQDSKPVRKKFYSCYILLHILTSFWELLAPKSWSKYFFYSFQMFETLIFFSDEKQRKTVKIVF